MSRLGSGAGAQYRTPASGTPWGHSLFRPDEWRTEADYGRVSRTQGDNADGDTRNRRQRPGLCPVGATRSSFSPPSSCPSLPELVSIPAGRRIRSRSSRCVRRCPSDAPLDAQGFCSGDRHDTQWAMRAWGDWIVAVPHLESGLGHGAGPVSKAYDVHRLTARRASGHSGCFAPGTDSRANPAVLGNGDCCAESA
jgi:hypothetical protein